MTLPTRAVGSLAAMLRSRPLRILHPIRALLVATLLSAIACFSPAAALAQSAGDEQYRDPLAGDTGGGNNPGSGSNSGAGSGSGSNIGASAGTPATAQQTSQSTTTQAPAGSASSAGASASGQLPRTGSDATLPLVGLGLVMLASGLVLHRKTLPARRAQGIYLFHN